MTNVLKASKVALALSALIGALGGVAHAQNAEALPPPPDGSETQLDENPLVNYVQTRFGISKEDAQERIELQGDIAALLENPAFTEDPGFAGVVVQNEPVYRVFLTYYDNTNKRDLLRLVPPQLRRYVQIKKARLNRDEVGSGSRAIENALERAGIEAVVSYREGSERFVIQAPDSSAAEVEAAIPRGFRDEFDYDSNPFPVIEQATTGSTTGYPANAGYDIGCTLAFPITYSYGGTNNRRGILTAGHCFDPGDPARTLRHSDGASTVFNSAIFQIARNDRDFAVLDITGMNTGYWLYFNNKQGVGGFSSSSWLRTKNFIRESASWIGMNVCKQGSTTGLTCGSVTDLDYPYSFFGGGTFIQVSNSLQSNLSDPGDSGGPWFTTVTSGNDEVSALGLHITGTGSGRSAWAIYMPIDRTFNTSGGPTNVRLFTTP